MKLLSAMYEAQDPFFLFDDCIGVVYPAQMEDYNSKDTALLLWGGADISPRYYGQFPSTMTTASTWPSKRDYYEERLIKRAVEMGMPIIGICRGAQFLCALNGGSLIQHLDGHETNHNITTKDGITLMANSTHHQMMLPGVAGEVLAWSSEPLSNRYHNGWGWMEVPPEKEVEVVWWKNWKALGIQGHPEYMKPSSKFVTYCQQLVEEYILK